jgi:hypothetical protein
MKPEYLFIKFSLSTLCYAFSFRIVCGGVYRLVEAWKTWRKQ